MTCVSNFKLTNSKNLNCQHFESLEIAHEFNVNKHLSKHGPILRLMILKRCLVWGSLQFEHSIIVPKFWWKSEFALIITLLHIIAHTWVEFKSKIEPLSIWDRVKENKLVNPPASQIGLKHLLGYFRVQMIWSSPLPSEFWILNFYIQWLMS